MNQREFESKIKLRLNPTLGYTTDEIAHIFQLPREEVISKCWLAKDHNLLRPKVIVVKGHGLTHWKYTPPRSRQFG